MVRSGNIFADIPARLSEEEAALLAAHPGAIVERVVSTGQASPPGFWYDQDWTEWVILLTGEAGLSIEGEGVRRTLRPGDHIELPAHVRHRVEWTSADPPTVWLAVHWKGGESSGSDETAAAQL
jgi:cupin 2 domain-containing protein